MFRFIPILTLLVIFMTQVPALAEPSDLAKTKVFSEILLKVDKLVCNEPEKIIDFYLPEKNLVLLVDDKRGLLKNRIAGYRAMMSEFRGLKCNSQRKVLSGKVGKEVGYLLVDEISSIVSDNTDNEERQHSVCSYVFSLEDNGWRIALEHCSTLPDYSIRPGDDALYYFHNPVY